MLVDNPILNSPFEEPARYWAYEQGQWMMRDRCYLRAIPSGFEP